MREPPCLPDGHGERLPGLRALTLFGCRVLRGPDREPVLRGPDREPVLSSPDREPVLSGPDREPVLSGPDREPQSVRPLRPAASVRSSPVPCCLSVPCVLDRNPFSRNSYQGLFSRTEE